jgi:glycine/D-amino acid oxidase-like deaminating enzyme
MTIDFLIVGQGLAGSLLAWELIKRNCKVLVVDNGLENASLCAAGLINPITGMRFVKSTQVDKLLPIAQHVYQQLGEFFQQNFYVEKNMLRIFNSEKESHNAQKRLQDLSYQAYLAEITEKDTDLELSRFKKLKSLYIPFGMIEQLQTAYLLTQPLLSALKQFFISNHCYQQQQFDYQEINFQPTLTWRGIAAKKIIFCEGYQLRDNPWFSGLPLQLAKGEILTLESQKPLPNNILNYGHWLIPLGNNAFRTGATFDTGQLDTHCTEQAKNLLLHSLAKRLPDLAAAKLVKHQANIRPCTLDKQPFIGQHPYYPQLAVFNGFGAKGSLQIPYYSQNFSDFLLKNNLLDKNIDIQRYQFV